MIHLFIILSIAAGILGGFYTDSYFGKLSPINPGEWRQNVYLVVGLILILAAMISGAYIANL